jgi:hypothetical protein
MRTRERALWDTHRVIVRRDVVPFGVPALQRNASHCGAVQHNTCVATQRLTLRRSAT